MIGANRDNGQSLVEYILILALVAIVVIAALTLLGRKGIQNTPDSDTGAVDTENIETDVPKPNGE